MYMPKVLVIKNLMFMIHTRDHGHPHVTVYLGTPENYEAFAKVRLDQVEVIESENFSQRDLNFILQETLENVEDFLGVWHDTRETK
jgi:hypothetical protein